MKNTTDNLTQLHLFADRARELSELRLLKTDSPWRFSMTLEAARVSKFEVDGPDEELLRSFLMTFRLFVLKSDEVFIKRIFNEAKRAIPAGQTRNTIEQLQHHWNCRLKHGPLAVFIGKELIAPERMLDLWINGYYFHNDTKKSSELNRLFGQSVSLIRLGFLMAIADLASIIIQTGHILDTTFGFTVEAKKTTSHSGGYS